MSIPPPEEGIGDDPWVTAGSRSWGGRLWGLTRGPAGIRGSLWRPLAVFRLLSIVYAAGLALHRSEKSSLPGKAALLLVLMAVWSLGMAEAEPTADPTGHRRMLWT